MKYNMDHISNTEICKAIDEWVHGERDRKIMKRRLVDKICYEPLAEEFCLSEKQARMIVVKNIDIVFSHLGQKVPENKNETKRIHELIESPDFIPRFFCQTS